MYRLAMKPLLLLFIGTFVWAQDMVGNNQSSSRPYYFSGPCTSHGSWTQEALTQTHRLREITTQLKDDPSCKALGDSLQRSFGEIQMSLQNTEKSMDGAQTSIRDLGQEIKALRESSMENPLLSKITSSHIVSRMFNLVRLKSLSNDQTNARPTSLDPEIRKQLVSNFGDRMSRVAGRGFTLFNSAIDSLPRLEGCLTKKNTMGQFFAASVSMLGALVSSGEDPLGNQTAMAISKIANYMREESFAEVLAKLNQQEFMASIQCIMETTSESYCSARDSNLLFTQMTAELNARRTQQKERASGPIPSGRKFDNPLNGFYILSQLSPIVTDWIFRIQIGSSPKLREDGTYQMTVMNNANNFYIKIKEIESEFNQLKRNIATYTDFSSKQNYAKDLVLNIADKILKGGGITGENFFQNAGSSFEIAFNLLGMDVPKEVREKGGMMTPEMWLNINYKDLPLFANPDNIPNIVWKKLAVVFEAGKKNMLGYYFKGFVYDPLAVTDESLLGLPYNIKNALSGIDNYLANLQIKIQKTSKDPTILGSITDTRIRLGKIFYRYNELMKYINSTKDMMTKRPTPAEEREYKDTLLKMNIALMEEVYDKFEVMLAKSGFLANRLVTYVTYDFQMFVKDGLSNANSESDLLYKEIAYASGRIAYEQLVQMAGNNPTNVQYDLQRASRIFKENLAAQEMLFTDSLVGILQQLKLSATNSYVDSRDVSLDSIQRAYNDGWQANPLHERSYVRRFLTGVWGSLKALTGFEEQKYPVHHLAMIGIRDDLAYSIDDENRSSENVFNRMCIQALSFNNYKHERWRALYNLCKEAFVSSPFNINQVNSELPNLSDDYLSVSFQRKFREGLPDYRTNHSKRVCAFRDYNRRNLVVYLTMNFKSTDILENNFSDNPYIDIKPDPGVNSVEPVKPPSTDAQQPSPESAEDINKPAFVKNMFIVESQEKALEKTNTPPSEKPKSRAAQILNSW